MERMLVIIILFIISFVFALRSMKDLAFSKELEEVLKKNSMKGVIVFFKDKIVHYSSKSSSSL